MEERTIQIKIIELIKMLESWGLGSGDWLVTDKFINKKHLQDLSRQSVDIHVMVKRYKLPWQTQETKQVLPPKDSPYFESFIKYITNDLQLDMEAVDKERFFSCLKFAEKIELGQNSVFLQLSPLYHAQNLGANLKESREDRQYGYYETLLKIKERLFLYAKEEKDRGVLAELAALQKERNKILPQPMAGLPVNTLPFKGRARLLLTLYDGEKVAKDDIIVTGATDVKWIPLLINAGGLVTERGGLTSHAAVTCRELDIPCLVGVKDVLFDIWTGDLIEIDPEGKCLKLIEPVSFDYD